MQLNDYCRVWYFNSYAVCNWMVITQRICTKFTIFLSYKNKINMVIKKSSLQKIIKHKAKISHSLLLLLFSRDNHI